MKNLAADPKHADAVAQMKRLLNKKEASL